MILKTTNIWSNKWMKRGDSDSRSDNEPHNRQSYSQRQQLTQINRKETNMSVRWYRWSMRCDDKLSLRGLSVYLWLHIWVVGLGCPAVATVGWIWKDSLKASLVGRIRTVCRLATILLRHLELEKSQDFFLALRCIPYPISFVLVLTKLLATLKSFRRR